MPFKPLSPPNLSHSLAIYHSFVASGTRLKIRRLYASPFLPVHTRFDQPAAVASELKRRVNKRRVGPLAASSQVRSKSNQKSRRKRVAQLIVSAFLLPAFPQNQSFLRLNMDPVTPQRSGGAADLSSHRPHLAAALFSPGVQLQSSSPLSGSEKSPQPSPGEYGENDLISHGYIFTGALPGDADYIMPDPETTSISAPGIATLTDEMGEFEDYDSYSYDDSHDKLAESSRDNALAEQQVRGGPYGLRTNIVASPRANRTALKAQERRRVSQAQEPQSSDAANAAASTSQVQVQSADDAAVPRPKRAPRQVVPHARKPVARSKLSEASAPPFELPPREQAPVYTALPPPQAFVIPSVPPSAPPQPLQQQPLQEEPSPPQFPPQQPPLQQFPPQRRAAGTSTKRLRMPTGATPPRQAQSATPFERSRQAPPQPMRASSLQPPATTIGTPDVFAPIPPEQFRGMITEFIAQGDFGAVGMPPPPCAWTDARRRQPQPPPDEDLEAKQEMEDDPLADEPEDDKQDANSGGRPTQAQREAYDRAFTDIRARLAQCATEARGSYDGVLKLFFQEENTGSRRSTNSWNQYQRYANYDDTNWLRERRRLDPRFPSEAPIPPSRPTNSTSGCGDDTIQARRRRFHGIVNTMEKLTDRCRLDDFFTFTILVGAHVNEDEKLGEIIAIPGTDDILYEALLTNTSDLIGILKNAGSTMMIKEQSKMRRDQRDATSSAAPDVSFGVVDAVPSHTAGRSCSAAEVAAPSSSATRRTHPAAASGLAPSVRRNVSNSPAQTMSPAQTLSPTELSIAAPNAAAAAAALLPAIIPMLYRDSTNKNYTIFPCEIREDTRDVQDLRRVIRIASMEDLGVDVFSGNNGFAWTVLGQQLCEKRVRIVNYPANVRLPSEAPSTKGSGSWTRGERRWLRASLAARSTPKQGLRFQRVRYPAGELNFVILSHDYALTPPDGAPDSAAVKAFWSSNAAPVHCTAGDNTSWEAVYDLDDPATLVRPAPTKAEVKEGKKKVEPVTRSKAKESQKRKADDEDDEDDEDELEAAEETTPPPAKKMRHQTPVPQVGGGAVIGSPRRVEVANAKRTHRDFTKTPPRVGNAIPRVHFTTRATSGSGSDSDDQPLQPPARPLQPPARPQPKPPVPLFDDSDDEPAPAPRRKPGSRKRAVPEVESEDEYSEDDDVAVDPPVRVTRANARHAAAPSKPTAAAASKPPAAASNPPAAASKPAAADSKPAPKTKTVKAPTQVFDAVELMSPPRKKSKATPTAPGAEGSMLAPTRKTTGQPRDSPHHAQPPTPAVAAPVALPHPLANLTEGQVARLLSLLAQAPEA
ncbi:hypothetical protein B0H13DRAFT_2363498 [Mycena leptocephala]|nr:hypothetical protein B0H13DRAFT_2363498 [Mycena leptocephala]